MGKPMPGLAPENVAKEEILEYITPLGLNLDDLQNKKILDIGAAQRHFAKFCLALGSNQIYSLEPIIFSQRLDTRKPFRLSNSDPFKKLDTKTVAAIGEFLPFKKRSFDLVIARFSVPIVCNKPIKIGSRVYDASARVKLAFQEIIRVLKPGGEARIWPAQARDYQSPKDEKSEIQQAIDREIERLKKNKFLRIDFLSGVRKAAGAIYLPTEFLLIKKLK